MKKNKRDKEIEQEIISNKQKINIKLMRDYTIVLKRAYSVYDEAEDIEVKSQIISILKKCNIYLLEKADLIKKTVLDRIKLYLHNIRSFDRDIILEEGNLLLESI